ncbi:uncharacterized protein HMPREF1541_04974 [Cyphellophora europaea CBS 101466]|uniref:25S rRNA (uridine-N(3))-methyltransferase BMT5-like domain-containing protein n=1 Tax=Cyphellophora europaea (strain CBS 101466) TaxID=1220924 RepID=W2RWJ6_CYPE1|nr:uncharacterized protein HMPREF1541_04974 [Cyphellophora europaea CBS 101466]ETN40695.1 hypothetical protein HMPREF1541_04974 [Cyphellophora europaea CBS 101466]
MGKVKKQTQTSNKHGPGRQGQNAIKRRQHSQVLPQKQLQQRKTPKVHPVQASQQPKVPFSTRDNVLLIGEGDFSFALSLIKNYRPGAVTATCYDTEADLVQKYPGVHATISKLAPEGFNGDASQAVNEPEDGESFEGFSPPSSPNSGSSKAAPAPAHSRVHVLYGIDATALSTIHRKTLRALGPFTKIVFNFPHVGGLSTDVNRQVRANQELLVKFFDAAKPQLASLTTTPSITSQRPPTTAKSDRYDTDESEASDDEATDSSPSTPSPQILVSLFTSHPYTLWNIRDLARHCGLQVQESFRFPWEAYPGYQHARTAGDITTGKDRSDEGKRRGKWRGEEREARCYVLEVKGEEAGRGTQQWQQRRQKQQQGKQQAKRKRGEESGEESD